MEENKIRQEMNVPLPSTIYESYGLGSSSGTVDERFPIEIRNSRFDPNSRPYEIIKQETKLEERKIFVNDFRRHSSSNFAEKILEPYQEEEKSQWSTSSYEEKLSDEAFEDESEVDEEVGLNVDLTAKGKVREVKRQFWGPILLEGVKTIDEKDHEPLSSDQSDNEDFEFESSYTDEESNTNDEEDEERMKRLRKHFRYFEKGANIVKDAYDGINVSNNGCLSIDMSHNAMKEHKEFLKKTEKDLIHKKVSTPVYIPSKVINFGENYENNSEWMQSGGQLMPGPETSNNSMTFGTSSQEKPNKAWPFNLLDVKEYPATSREISTFLYRTSNDEFSALDKTGSKQIRRVRSFRILLKKERIKVDFNTPAFPVNFDFYPPDLNIREKPRQLLRPVYIEGTAVAYSYDKSYAPKFGKRWSAQHYTKERVLPVFPLVNACLRMILCGHKVTVLLPDYYKVPYFDKQKKLKVDNLFGFNKLKDLGLLQFINLNKIPDNVSYPDHIKSMTSKIGACLLSNNDVIRNYWGMYYNKRKGILPKETDDYDDNYQQMPKIKAPKGVLKNALKIARISGNAGERHVNVHYFTDSREQVIAQEFSSYCGLGDVPHNKRKFGWHRIKGKINFYYTQIPGDIINWNLKLSEQLNFGDQIKQVLALADLYPVTTVTRRGIEILLYFAHKMKVCSDDITEFIIAHPPYQPPKSDICQPNVPHKEGNKIVTRLAKKAYD